jgi:hypothetical protein
MLTKRRFKRRTDGLTRLVIYWQKEDANGKKFQRYGSWDSDEDLVTGNWYPAMERLYNQFVVPNRSIIKKAEFYWNRLDNPNNKIAVVDELGNLNLLI